MFIRLLHTSYVYKVTTIEDNHESDFPSHCLGTQLPRIYSPDCCSADSGHLRDEIAE